MTPPEPSPPANVPEELAAVLRRCDGPQLRAVVDYARQRLHDRPPIPDAVESRHGEELVRVDDHGAYTVAVVERTSETGESRGRVAYRVKWEPDVSDEEGRYRWHYLGTVCGDADGGRDD